MPKSQLLSDQQLRKTDHDNWCFKKKSPYTLCVVSEVEIWLKIQLMSSFQEIKEDRQLGVFHLQQINPHSCWAEVIILRQAQRQEVCRNGMSWELELSFNWTSQGILIWSSRKHLFFFLFFCSFCHSNHHSTSEKVLYNCTNFLTQLYWSQAILWPSLGGTRYCYNDCLLWSGTFLKDIWKHFAYKKYLTI